MELPNIAAYAYQDVHVWSALLTCLRPPTPRCPSQHTQHLIAQYGCTEGDIQCWFWKSDGRMASVTGVIILCQLSTLCFAAPWQALPWRKHQDRVNPSFPVPLVVPAQGGGGGD